MTQQRQGKCCKMYTFNGRRDYYKFWLFVCPQERHKIQNPKCSSEIQLIMAVNDLDGEQN